MLTGQRVTRVRGDRLLFAGVDLTMRGPERIALTGPQRRPASRRCCACLSGHLDPDAGTVQRGDGRVAYLSQRLDLLDPRPHGRREPGRVRAEPARTPVACICWRDSCSAATGFICRWRALSGGERLRATLACVLYAEPAPQLLLLDEPTNNLDLVSVGQLESALNAYRGAFVVVSHDERFLADIAVRRRLRLADGRLEEDWIGLIGGRAGVNQRTDSYPGRGKFETRSVS